MRAAAGASCPSVKGLRKGSTAFCCRQEAKAYRGGSREPRSRFKPTSSTFRARSSDILKHHFSSGCLYAPWADLQVCPCPLPSPVCCGQCPPGVMAAQMSGIRKCICGDATIVIIPGTTVFLSQPLHALKHTHWA